MNTAETATRTPRPSDGPNGAPAAAQEHRDDHGQPGPQKPAPVHDDHDAIPTNLKKPHFLTIAVVLVLFAGLLAGLFAIGFFPHKKAEEQAQADATEASNDEIRVSVVNPQPVVAAKEVILPATVRPNQDTLIVPRASGYVKKLYVDIQDKVKEGQLLAEIDAPEVDAQLLQARASVEQEQANVTKAQADLALTQRNLERLQSVKTEVTRQELDTSTTARDQAQAAVEQAKANVAAAEANVQRLQVLQSFQKITAPFDGTITARNFDVGALLTAGQSRELFRIQQSQTVRVFVNVPQVYATDIATSQPAILNVRNFPNRPFAGTIARTASAVDPSTRTMPFELHFPNPDGSLVPGMFGEARLPVASPPKALLVPVSAMLFNAKGTQVAVVKDNKVHFKEVTINRDLGTDLEILSGVSPEDLVVKNPGERLVEGVEVQATLDTPTKPQQGVAAATPAKQ
jgi:RND family efflux transporter MFP subunit